MKRGAVSKNVSKLITLWVPSALLPYINQGVIITDTDRSKFIRQAVREKLQRNGITISDQEAA